MPNELKPLPCPFCGGKAGVYWWDSDEKKAKAWEECDDESGEKFPVVECRNCGCYVTFGNLGYGKEVIAAWNRRANDENLSCVP